MTRRIIQIAATYDMGEGVGNREPTYQPDTALYALCNDGTVWRLILGSWHPVDGIPQDDAQPDAHTRAEIAERDAA